MVMDHYLCFPIVTVGAFYTSGVPCWTCAARLHSIFNTPGSPLTLKSSRLTHTNMTALRRGRRAHARRKGIAPHATPRTAHTHLAHLLRCVYALRCDAHTLPFSWQHCDTGRVPARCLTTRRRVYPSARQGDAIHYMPNTSF